MKRRLAALLVVLPLALGSCSSQDPQSPETSAESAAPAPDGDDSQIDGLEDLDSKVAAIEEQTNTQIGFSLYDGTHATNAGSGGALPAWSTIKVPIALTALEHCDDRDFVVEQTTAAIDWSDNDAAFALWRCIGSDEEASRLVGEEIATSGVSVHVEPAFGTTTWPIPAQARYAQHLASIPADNPVIQEMHKIDAEHSYGLGTIADMPFKGGWSDADDGSFHVRQLGFFTADGTDYGIAIAARSLLGSEQDCHDALDQLAALLTSSDLQLRAKDKPVLPGHADSEHAENAEHAENTEHAENAEEPAGTDDKENAAAAEGAEDAGADTENS